MSRARPGNAQMAQGRPRDRTRPARPRRLRLRVWAKYLGIAAGVLLLIAMMPVVWVETRCYSKQDAARNFQSELPAQFRREEVNSYLTYPEWSIVHAYQDLAAVTRRGSESDFDYLAYVTRYWGSLCHIVGYASARGHVSGEYRSMLHIIGVSFSAEMAVKGLWEKSIGLATSWLRGTAKTPEDQFALKVADDYAGFLAQTPWYEFPFAAKLAEFWLATPFGWSSPVRAIERRLALTLEYGVKSIYAQAIGLLAAASPADLRIRSVVEGGDPAHIPDVQVIGTMNVGWTTVIETPRYAAFTRIARDFASSGVSFTEIAGNETIMVGVLVPRIAQLTVPGVTELFSVPEEFRPGYRRVIVSVPVKSLTMMIGQLSTGGAELEHVYDY